MELKEIKAVIDLMSRNGLTEFELERDNFKIRICKSGTGGGFQVIPSQLPQSAAPAVPSHPAQPQAEVHQNPPQQTLPTINSPMVGTFYRSASPDSPSYVEPGTQVNEDTVVCIIEAMKVMNEIKAEMKGVITEILVEGGKPVEFGQPLFCIKPL